DTVNQNEDHKEMHQEAESSNTGSTNKKKDEAVKGESKAIIVWNPDLKRATEVRDQIPTQHMDQRIESPEEQ
ncbi:hypothetical protein HAX54_013804, partial [Datura stramonium]|nr:hypothetical protein [Datura stramonium]